MHKRGNVRASSCRGRLEEEGKAGPSCCMSNAKASSCDTLGERTLPVVVTISVRRTPVVVTSLFPAYRANQATALTTGLFLSVNAIRQSLGKLGFILRMRPSSWSHHLFIQDRTFFRPVPRETIFVLRLLRIEYP